ncbi:MAG: AMP-binding protein [Pseudomonadota bacterium]
MPLIRRWLKRADPAAPALILPDGEDWSFGALAGMAGRGGLHAPAGGAAALARGLLDAALGGGTAFPLPPGIEPEAREELLALAARAAHPDLALIIATSGSTGAPKGVRLPWRAVAAASRMSARALDLRPGDAWLACLPLYHVGGALIPYRCLRAGATAVVHEGFDAAAVARDLAARRVTHLSLVPPMLARLLDAGIAPGPALRCALVGGAALHDALLERARAAGWPVRTSWGMSETCATATVDGVPLPGVRVRVAAAGTLEIATPARMAGYLGAADAGEWMATRDLGAIDATHADGRVRILGRADDMLVSAGVNVHPLEVEARLADCPGVREAGVTGVADPAWGDVIAAAYEGEAHEAALEDWCRAHLPAARRPRRFLRVERLPRLASGKLDRRALPALWGTA